MKKLSLLLITIFLLLDFVEANTNSYLTFNNSTKDLSFDSWSNTAPNEILKRRRRRPARRNIFQKGKSFIDIGFGYPNFSYNYLMANALTFGFSTQPTLYTDVKNFSWGVAHFRYEYAVWDIFGLSFRGHFSNYDVSWNLAVPDFDDDGNLITKKVKSGYKGYTLDMSVRFDWHIVTNMKIDLYTGMGFGYSLNTMDYYSEDKKVAEDPNKDIPQIYIPVAFEGTIGLRYYFNPHFGIYTEIGYSQSPFEMGLSFRF